jgi:hypothetical protein
MPTPFHMIIAGVACVALNVINFFLIMTVAEGWGCPAK